MVRKEIMEVFVTSGGEVFQDYNRAIKQSTKEDIIELIRKKIGVKYFLLEDEYKMISDFIYDNFEEIKEIVE